MMVRLRCHSLCNPSATISLHLSASFHSHTHSFPSVRHPSTVQQKSSHLSIFPLTVCFSYSLFSLLLIWTFRLLLPSLSWCLALYPKATSPLEVALYQGLFSSLLFSHPLSSSSFPFRIRHSSAIILPLQPKLM